MDVSVIIPAYNEAAYIGKLLDSLSVARQQLAPGRHSEIIVVDNGSTDATAAIAQEKGATVVQESERKIAAVRNAGARAARGGTLIFIDADNLASPNLLAEIDRVMQSGRYVGGGVEVLPDRWSIGIAITYVFFWTSFWLLGVSAGVIFASRQAFNAVGGFDPTLYAGEDAKIVWQLKQWARGQGKRFCNLRSAHIITSTRKFDLYGDWLFFKMFARWWYRPFRVLKDRKAVGFMWYDVRKP
ncbi:MAG TPA: glycosyltransferase [Nitrospiria bacterium]|nr:glycosyltransferase [Nitrospiria bacterium]